MTRDSKETMRHGERTKSTQTTRSLPARAAGARVRLVFALISVITLLATMFVTGPFQARVAEAVEAGICTPSTGVIGDQNGVKTDSDPGVATWVGRDMYVGAPKTDVTEYGASTDSGHSGEVAPEQSYAVEAEGLTVVKGKLSLNGVKGMKDGPDYSGEHDSANFNGHGFRFGTVGFGANLRPVAGSDALVVAGEGSGITLKDADGKDVNVLAWDNAGRGYVRADSMGPGYTARIKSTNGASKAHWINPDENYDDLERNPKETDANGYVKYVSLDSIYNFDDPWRNDPDKGWIPEVYRTSKSDVNWDNGQGGSAFPEHTSVLQHVQLNKAWISNTANNWTDLSGYQNTITSLSQVLRARPSLGKAVSSSAPKQDSFVRQKYDSADYKVTFNIGDNDETLITFTGNGTADRNASSETYPGTGAYKVIGGSVMQVFTLDASLLTNGATNGISFRFDNIPDNASVVVNVVGNENSDIDFNNGWRFWWNGAEIGNYYTVFDQDNKQVRNNLYSHAASALMWNFADTTGTVRIRGGQITDGQSGKVEITRIENGNSKYYFQYIGGNEQVQITDDPVANMIGSILVPKGSLETHVSTNGRVWVGKDYMMYNPTGLSGLAWINGFEKNGWHETVSASVIEQDQERHNFGWRGEISDKCAVLEWQKVDSDGNALAGTEWAVYASKDAAVEHDTTAALVTVLDDGHDDWAIGTNGQGTGKFQVRRLNPNATYYLREISAPDGYAVNSNIYEIKTGAGNQAETDIDNVVDGGFNQPSTAIDKVYDSSGNEINSDDDKLLWTANVTGAKAAIVNHGLPDVEWEKVDSETGALLGGSEWKLYKKQVENGTTTYPVIKESITDAYGTMVYLDTKTAGWPAEGVTEIPKVSYRIDKLGGWKCVEMHLYGDGIYGAYLPSQGNKIWFSFFLGTDDKKTSQYRPGGGSSRDHFICNEGVAHITVRTKEKIEQTQPKALGFEPAYVDLDSRSGRFKIGGLTEGEYTLQETKAPEGYWLPEAASSGQPDPRYYTFTVSLNNGKYEISWNSSTIKIGDDEITTTGASTVSGSSVGRISNTPTEVSWWKIDVDDKDSDGNVKNAVLAGAEWQLQKWSLKNNSTTEYEYRTFKDNIVDCVDTEGGSPTCANDSVDQNPEPGKFTLKRLPVGKYRLKETKAPLGYVLPADEYIYFEITNTESGTNDVQWKQGWSDVDGSGNPTNLTQGNKAPINVNKVSDSESAHAVGNTRKPGEVTWEKIAQKPQRQHKQGQVDDPDTPAELSEEENHQLLAGSEWSLQYTPYQQTTGTVTLTIKDCMPADNGSGDVNCTAINDSYSWAVDVEETAGKFKISGMPWGDYVLTESKAPDGYNLDTTQHAFSIGVKQMNGNTVVGSIGNTAVSGDANQQVISINLGEIENEPGVVLPVTGAEGRHLWPAIVGALFVLAAFGCAVALRMRE